MNLNILVGFCFKSVLKEMQAEQATLGHINTFSSPHRAMTPDQCNQNQPCSQLAEKVGAEDSKSKLLYCQELIRASQNNLSTWKSKTIKTKLAQRLFLSRYCGVCSKKCPKHRKKIRKQNTHSSKTKPRISLKMTRPSWRAWNCSESRDSQSNILKI